MSNSTRRQASGRRLVLAFDGGCAACGGLARRIEERVGAELEVRSLRHPQVREWREAALGEDAPWAPTLIEITGPEIRAWTGRRMGLALGRFLGPVDTWRVMQVLGEFGASPPQAKDTLAEQLPAGGGGLLSRGQFLKGVGGAAVAMGLLSAGSPGGLLVRPAGAAQGGATTSSARGDTNDDAVGASIVHPAEYFVEREEHTFDDTYGFTLWKPKPASSRGGAHDHGEKTPAVRVARARRLRPEDIERRVRARLAEHPDLRMKREEVRVGQKRLKGVAVGPIPGGTPSTEVYVAAEGRVHQINVYGDGLDREGRELLRGLRFGAPSQSIDSLGLKDGKDSEPHHLQDDGGLRERERAAREEAVVATAEDRRAVQALSVPSYGEYQIEGGCWVADSTFFVQTQHGPSANSSGTWARRWNASYPGWTKIGIPNYWGQYTHGSLGYGRCASDYYVNDMYAIDYPLGKGDVVFSPFKGGTVTFAGRNYSHKNFGIFVVIKADNGKYVSTSAHLNALASGIRPGKRVTDATVIGYAGKTGDPSIPVGPSHLHQAFYRYPSYRSDGSPYGGRGLKVVYHHYVGTAAKTGPGVYNFGRVAPNYEAVCREGKTCGEGYWISN